MFRRCGLACLLRVKVRADRGKICWLASAKSSIQQQTRQEKPMDAREDAVGRTMGLGIKWMGMFRRQCGRGQQDTLTRYLGRDGSRVHTARQKCSQTRFLELAAGKGSEDRRASCGPRLRRRERERDQRAKKTTESRGRERMEGGRGSGRVSWCMEETVVQSCREGGGVGGGEFEQEGYS
jgi:hypothetical protein